MGYCWSGPSSCRNAETPGQLSPEEERADRLGVRFSTRTEHQAGENHLAVGQQLRSAARRVGPRRRERPGGPRAPGRKPPVRPPRREAGAPLPFGRSLADAGCSSARRAGSHRGERRWSPLSVRQCRGARCSPTARVGWQRSPWAGQPGPLVLQQTAHAARPARRARRSPPGWFWRELAALRHAGQTPVVPAGGQLAARLALGVVAAPTAASHRSSAWAGTASITSTTRSRPSSSTAPNGANSAAASSAVQVPDIQRRPTASAPPTALTTLRWAAADGRRTRRDGPLAHRNARPWRPTPGDGPLPYCPAPEPQPARRRPPYVRKPAVTGRCHPAGLAVQERRVCDRDSSWAAVEVRAGAAPFRLGVSDSRRHRVAFLHGWLASPLLAEAFHPAWYRFTPGGPRLWSPPR